MEKLLGINSSDLEDELVAYKGGDIFGFESKVVGVVSPSREVCDLF